MKVYIIADEDVYKPYSDKTFSQLAYDYFGIPPENRASSLFAADRVLALEHPISTRSNLNIRFWAFVARLLGKYVTYVREEDLA